MHQFYMSMDGCRVLSHKCHYVVIGMTAQMEAFQSESRGRERERELLSLTLNQQNHPPTSTLSQ